MPGSSKGKQPIRPPPEQPAQAGSKSKDAQQLPVDKSKQANPRVAQNRSEQQMQSDHEGKQRQEPLHKQPSQSSSKGKQPVWRSSEEPVEAGSRSQDPQQLPLDKSKQASPKVAQNHPKQQVQSSAEGEQRQDPSPKQPAGSKSKGKQPVRPAPEQPLQSSPRSENHQQLPLDKPTRANPKATQPHPKPQVQSDSESDSEDQQGQDPQPKTAASSKSKGKQPIPTRSFTFPKCFIARIPVKRGTAIKRVKISICPDTAFRHPQTFFFKNIPQLEPYWGWMNDKASTATRILRLDDEGRPTPYFLMVCRGEYPKVISPRNKNGVFLGMDEPIFGDAFVFKLSYPELNADGYTRYANIEKDIGSIDWLPPAIRRAARLVEIAKPHNANPGFPDMANYADRKTMGEDTQRLMRWGTIIAKMEIKHATNFPIDEESGQPDLERIEDTVEKWAVRVRNLQEGGILPNDEGSGSGDYQSIHDFWCEVTGFRDAINDVTTDAEGDEYPSASTDITSRDPETFKFPQKVIDQFMAIKKRYPTMQSLAKRILDNRIMEGLSAKEPTGDFDDLASVYMIEAMDSVVAGWRNGGVILTDSSSKMMDELLVKARGVMQAMQRNESKKETHKKIIEMNKLYQVLLEEASAVEAMATEAAAALADPAPEANEDGISNARFELLHIPDESGSTHHFLKRLD